MRSEDEIRERLREYHGMKLEREMGGMEPYARARELLWALGYDENVDIPLVGSVPKAMDLREYIDT